MGEFDDSKVRSVARALATAPQEKDAEIIVKVFKDKLPLLKEMRTLMFGGELLPDQKSHIAAVFADPELRNLIRRRFLPDMVLDTDAMLGVSRDAWSGVEGVILGASKDMIEQTCNAKTKLISFVKIGLALLENPDGPKVPMQIQPIATDPLQIELLARNMYARLVDDQLSWMYLVSNQAQKPQPPQAGSGRAVKQAKEPRLRNQ